MNQADTSNSIHIPKIFLICDRSDTAPAWGYILRSQGLRVVLESVVDKVFEQWFIETPDLCVIDIDTEKREPLELCKKVRDISIAPILLILPDYHERRILDAYEIGVDDVIVKPISPPVFSAKIMAWARHSWSISIHGVSPLIAGMYKLDPAQRCIIDPHGTEIKLTNLEFRLLHLLMDRPGEIINTDVLINSVWGGYGRGNQVMLKNVVYRLRKKIEADPSCPVQLRTWSGGYSFSG